MAKDVKPEAEVAAGVLDGFHVQGFGAALLGSLIYSALGLVIDSALQRLFARQ